LSETQLEKTWLWLIPAGVTADARLCFVDFVIDGDNSQQGWKPMAINNMDSNITIIDAVTRVPRPLP
jgi:hypothetical protein